MNIEIKEEGSVLDFLMEQLDQREDFFRALQLKVVEHAIDAAHPWHQDVVQKMFYALLHYAFSLDHVTCRQWLREMHEDIKPCLDYKFIEWVVKRRQAALNLMFESPSLVEANTFYLYWQEGCAHYTIGLSSQEKLIKGQLLLNRQERYLLKTYGALPLPSVNRFVRQLRRQGILSLYTSIMEKDKQETIDKCLQHQHFFFRFIEMYFLEFIEMTPLFPIKNEVDYEQFEAFQKELIFWKNEQQWLDEEKNNTYKKME